MKLANDLEKHCHFTLIPKTREVREHRGIWPTAQVCFSCPVSHLHSELLNLSGAHVSSGFRKRDGRKNK